MTPDRADVLVMQTMIDTMVGIPKFSYPARQRGAKKPANEFAHIRVLEEYQVGVPAKVLVSEVGNIKTFAIASPARIRYRVGVVETTGIPSAKILHGWTTEAMKALMISTGYGFKSCHPLSSEDTLLEKEWEYRKGFSIEMYVTRTFEEVVDTLDSVQISARYIEGNLNEILDTYIINQN